MNSFLVYKIRSWFRLPITRLSFRVLVMKAWTETIHYCSGSEVFTCNHFQTLKNKENWVVICNYTYLPNYNFKCQLQKLTFWTYLARLSHGQALLLDSYVVKKFLRSVQHEAGNFGPKLQPRGRFFGPWFFIILKNSHKDLSNEGSNFILSSLEVGHWVAQT